MLDPKEEDLEKLAETCLATAKQIKEHLAANKQPQPTFDQTGPSAFPATTPEIQQARLGLRTAARRLYDLASGPEDIVTWHLYQSCHDLNAFRYVFHYNIHTAVPLDGTITYTDLASKLSLDASQLKQMLRQIMPIHVFTEPKPGHVAHTASSRLLATDAGIASYTGFMVEGTFPYAACQIETFEKWGHGRPEPNRTAVSHYYATDLSMFEYFETHAPSVRDRFARLMTHMSSNPLMANGHVASGFDWSSLPQDGVVVDVAGGMGHCSNRIAERTAPTVKLIVQDLPKIIAQASDPATCVIPQPLRGRFEFMAHDFYEVQPVKGAAVYFLRMILHSYSDAYALRILRNIIPSSRPKMTPTSKLIIMDQVMPRQVNTLPEPLERIKRSQDLQMMLLCNAKERDETEWADLFARAGEGLISEGGTELGILAIRTPVGSMMSLIEVGFVSAAGGSGADGGSEG
ncbi:hypothetical protein A1O7_07543 [Cladophialophora yegresii CBS 114405]|uniref:O-methyltransferase C-terminal domain-containing protein n=1 Tax=Cladophialophora yegresii CBS 114405 TaxID=1182544 RepID=W9VY78_9EURO|nr:uncharacterized protein A1O7_07543 [Cladophialophora yegresii CBS 114405]EXJ57196.1 hypothetical protein A1O7_07543 [Cladophialophora yegresii CBS 114405]